MNLYTFTFFLVGELYPTVVTTKAQSYDEALRTIQRYCDGVFADRVAPYSTRLRSTEAISPFTHDGAMT